MLGRRLIAVPAIALGALAAGAAPAHALAAQPCGIFKPCVGPDIAPPKGESYDGSTFEVTLNADRARPKTGQVVTFTGAVTKDGAPVPAGQIDLVAARFPYTSAEIVASTGPTSDSTYRFTHVPQANTRYYVQTADLDPGEGSFAMTSATLFVRVFATLKRFEVSVPQPGVVKMTLSANFPDGVEQRLSGRKMRWYIIRGKGEAQRLTKVAVTRTASGGAARIVKAKTLSALPRGSYRFRGTFCLSLGVSRDTGVGDPSEPCP